MTAESLEATRREVEIRDMVLCIKPHQPEIADVLTYLLAENRRMRRIIAAMEERIETRQPVSAREMTEHMKRAAERMDRARGAYREYAQSGAYDPRD